MEFKLEINGSIEDEIVRVKRNVARAMTRGVRDCAEDARRGAESAVRAAGFSTIPVETKLYPKNRETISPTAIVYTPVRYATVFTEDTTISGRPYLWLPLRSAPRGMSASEYALRVGPLFTLRREGRPPLLGARKSGGRMVPMYVGVRQVHIPKKFDFIGPVRAAFRNLQQYVDRYI